MLKGRRGSEDIKIDKIIFSSPDKIAFVNKVEQELLKDTNTDYLDFSLLMGLYFEKFNLYNYVYIKPDVRKIIVNSKPDRKYTNYSKIAEYFYSKYGIKGEVLSSIICKMLFCVDNDNDYELLYNNDVTRDLGLILMGVSLKKEFNSCFNAIDYFYEVNDSCKLKIN